MGWIPQACPPIWRAWRQTSDEATPDRIWRHFLDSTGTLHVDEQTLTLELRARTYHPVLIDAGLADQPTPIPWLNGRQLKFRFPPR